MNNTDISKLVDLYAKVGQVINYYFKAHTGNITKSFPYGDADVVLFDRMIKVQTCVEDQRKRLRRRSKKL